MEFRKTLSEVLENQIRLKHRSIKQFSETSKIPYMTISCVLKRGVENTTIATLKKICDALGISITKLFQIQALDTIQFKLLNPNYTNDDLIENILECELIPKKYYSDSEKEQIAQNFRFVLSEDWI